MKNNFKKLKYIFYEVNINFFNFILSCNVKYILPLHLVNGLPGILISNPWWKYKFDVLGTLKNQLFFLLTFIWIFDNAYVLFFIMTENEVNVATIYKRLKMVETIQNWYLLLWNFRKRCSCLNMHNSFHIAHYLELGKIILSWTM